MNNLQCFSLHLLFLADIVGAFSYKSEFDSKNVSSIDVVVVDDIDEDKFARDERGIEPETSR